MHTVGMQFVKIVILLSGAEAGELEDVNVMPWIKS